MTKKEIENLNRELLKIEKISENNMRKIRIKFISGKFLDLELEVIII